MIYQPGRDQNVTTISRFIRKFGFFPVFGEAGGLRQPVHAKDVAAACQAALVSPEVKSSYVLSGGEILTYQEMVRRIFHSLDIPVRIVHLPVLVYQCAVLIGNTFGLRLPLGGGARMNQDLVFDHGPAARDLGFKPQKFLLSTRKGPWSAK